MNQTQLSARENFIFDAISEMARLTTPVQIADALGRTAGKLGFDSLGITALPPLSRGADPVVLAEQAPEGFREFYTHERLYLADHIAAHARVAVRLFCYSEAPYDSKESAKHRRFMQALDHYGLAEGIVVPVGHQRRQPACVWLSGKGPELHDD